MNMKTLNKNGKIVFQKEEFNYIRILQMKSSLLTQIHRVHLQKTPVAICLNRSVEYIVAIMALLDAGIPYVPIIPSYPDVRLKHIVTDCNIKTILTKRKYAHKFCDTNMILLDDLQYDLHSSYPTRDPDVEIDKEDLAYILYTSGTSGMPKGVEISRNSLECFVKGFSSAVPMEKGTKIACISSPTFDIFFVESIYPLLYGFTVVLATKGEADNPRKLKKFIYENDITVVQITPSRLISLYRMDKTFSSFKKVKQLLIGGEDIPVWLYEKLRECFYGEVINLYGPTEATIWISGCRLDKTKDITIGKPFEGANIYVMDSYLNPLPPGTKGEICLTGDYLARGYRNDKELTEKKFVTQTQLKRRIYKTGDLGIQLPDGTIKYLCRKDKQVKFRGYRIELQDIENNVMRLPAVTGARAVIHKDKLGNDSLVVFYTCDTDITAGMLYDFLLQKIPEYMLPNKFIRVADFPRTVNGKLDMNALLLMV